MSWLGFPSNSWLGFPSNEIAGPIRIALSFGVVILLGAAHWNSSPYVDPGQNLSIRAGIVHEIDEIVK